MVHSVLALSHYERMCLVCFFPLLMLAMYAGAIKLLAGRRNIFHGKAKARAGATPNGDAAAAGGAGTKAGNKRTASSVVAKLAKHHRLARVSNRDIFFRSLSLSLLVLFLVYPKASKKM